LKDAVLSIHTEGDRTVAASLVDAFGAYGVPLTSLTREEAASVALEFLHVHDWEFDQGAIPRFLNKLVTLFPDETFNLLLRRIELNAEARANHISRFRVFGLIHQEISFAGIHAEKRFQLAQRCIARFTELDSDVEFAKLFWIVAGLEDSSLSLVLSAASKADERRVRNIVTLISHAEVAPLAFTKLGFVSSLLKCFSGGQREQIVKAVAYQARGPRSGGFVGDPNEYMARRQKQFADQVDALPDDPDLEDLVRALRN
jgi:hypothetical protein